MTHDPIIIEATYAAMPDELLLLFARDEARQLPPLSIELLKKELAKRGMLWPEDISAKIQKKDAGDIQLIVLSLLLRDKTAAMIAAEIEALFIGKEVIRNDAEFILKEANTHLQKKCEEMQRILLIGLAFFVCGFAVTFLPMRPGKNDLFVILAYCSMIFGSIRMLHGYFYKRRYKCAIDKLNVAILMAKRLPEYYVPPDDAGETHIMA